MNLSNLQVVLLAGGLGTRIREETINRPKPMIEIGGYPILWHLMKYFSQYGISNFVICSGYKADVVVDYFTNYSMRTNDFTISLGRRSEIIFYPREESHDNWTVSVVYTGGSEVGTGGRLFRARKFIDTEPFICTYGDGLSNINVASLVQSHIQSGRKATVTVVNPTSRYGVVELNKDNLVSSFREKPSAEGWVNGGFFVFQKSIFEYLDDTVTLEAKPLQELAQSSQLNAFQHKGFWKGMDTFREYELLQSLWQSNDAPWKNW